MDALRSRLASLRRQSGAAPAADASADTGAAGLRPRLERLGRARPRPTEPLDDAGLAAHLGGAPGGPGILLVETLVPWDDPHGRAPLGEPGALQAALEAFGHQGPPVFMDTETTGLAGGSGTVAFLLGLGLPEPDGLRVRQYLLTRYAGEAALLEGAAADLAGCGALVTYNGRSFDGPLLATRCRLARRADPFAEPGHLDLLGPVRAAFGKAWPGCRLATAEARLLGLHRRGDLPGSEAPAAWIAWLQRRDPRLLEGVLRHNHLDIVSLAALLPRLHGVYREPATHGDCDVAAVARHHRRQGRGEEAYGQLRGARHRLDIPGRLELAREARRRREWALATEIWRELARDDHPEALEALAKYHEHRRGDVAEALRLTRRLLSMNSGAERHRRREARLRTKQPPTGR
jgi:hypothetical protein